jgi:hypothetical protein
VSGKSKEPLTTEQKAQVATLSAAGWSQNKVARTIGRSRHAVKNALAKPEVQKAVHDEKQELAGIFRQKSRDVVTSISDADISRASLQQKSISSGVLLDKSLLLTGEAPMSINVQILLDVASAIRRQDAEADAEDQRKWDAAHTLPAIAQTQPSPQPKHPTANPGPKSAAFPNTTNRPTPTARYQSVRATPISDDADESPLLHGLPR